MTITEEDDKYEIDYDDDKGDYNGDDNNDDDSLSLRVRYPNSVYFRPKVPI